MLLPWPLAECWSTTVSCSDVDVGRPQLARGCEKVKVTAYVAEGTDWRLEALCSARKGRVEFDSQAAGRMGVVVVVAADWSGVQKQLDWDRALELEMPQEREQLEMVARMVHSELEIDYHACRVQLDGSFAVRQYESVVVTSQWVLIWQVGFNSGTTYRIRAKDIKQCIRLADNCTPAMNQSLVVISRAQRKTLANLVLELFDRGAGSKTREQ